MDVFYSLIQISPNPIIDDQISIGLLMKSKEKTLIKFSDKNMSIAGSLLNDAKLVKFLSKQISKRIKVLNQQVESDKTLFNFDFLSANLFNHLHKSHHGILRFSEPSLINIDGSQENFNRLFSKLIDSTDSKEKQTSNTFTKRIERDLILQVKNRMHTHYKFKKNFFPALYFNFDIDAIGKNGSIYAIKTIDFNSTSLDTIDKNIQHYGMVKEQLSKTYLGSNKFILMADEPTSIKSDEHKAWEYHKNSDTFQFKHLEELGAIVQETIDLDVQKFI